MIALGSRWRKKGLDIDPARFEVLGIDLEQTEVEVCGFNATSETASEPVVAPIIDGDVGLERWSVSERSLTDNYELVSTPPEMSEQDKLALKKKLVSSWGDDLQGGLISYAN